jgi:GT2 family glycosyltransferase
MPSSRLLSFDCVQEPTSNFALASWGSNVPSFSVMIPHYTNASRTLALVRAIRNAGGFEPKRILDNRGNENERENCEIVVVDDASPDGSGAELAHSAGELGFVFVANEQNLGFSRTNNRGAAIANGDILVFSNSDIGFAESVPPALVFDRLARTFSDESIGAAMPLVYNTALGEVENANDLWANRGLLWLRRLPITRSLTARALSEIHNEAGVESADGESSFETGMIDSVLCGAFFAMPRLLFLKLGGFDPTFTPYYWEDVELGVRVKKHGKRIVLVTDSLVLHEHCRSISIAASEKRRWGAMLENQLRITRMWGGELGVRRMKLWHALRSLRSLSRGDLGAARKFLR